MMKKRFIFAVLALFIVTGAGVFWLLNREQELRLDVISRKDALEDYDYLWDTLEENYPFFGVAERKYGLDVQQMKQEYRQQLEGMEKEIDFLKFYRLMERCIGEFKGMGHIGIISSEYLQAFLIADQAQPGAVPDWRTQNVLSEEVKERYQFLKEAEPEKASQPASQNYLAFDRFPNGIAYLRIGSFAGEYIEQDHESILKFFQENADAPYLLIDICGNGGGNSTYWSYNLVAPNLEAEKFAPYLYITPYGERAQDFMKVDILQRSALNDSLDELQELPSLNQQDLVPGWYWGEDSYYVGPEFEEKVFPGKIFLLVDSGTASAADAFAYFCKKTGFATVIGMENACGSGPGGNFVMDRLPHSNLLFCYRPVLALDMDGAAIEEFGIEPDVLLPTRAKNSNDKISPLAACLNYIEELEENK